MTTTELKSPATSPASNGSVLYIYCDGEPCPKCGGFKTEKPMNADGTPWSGMGPARYDLCSKCNGSGVAPNEKLKHGGE